MNVSETQNMVSEYEDLLTPERNLEREANVGSTVLFKAISNMVTKLFHSLARKYRIPYTYVGIATSTAVVNANVNVIVNRDGVTRVFKNKSGESIAVNDKLYILAVDGSLSSAFVLVKY